MKKLYSLLMVLAMIVSFSACGDSKPDDLPKAAVSESLTKTEKIVANANSITPATIEFKLSDYSALDKYVNWVTKGTLDTRKAEISFSDLPKDEDFKLTKIKISLNNKISISLPDLTESQSFSDPKHIDFLQSLLDEIVANKNKTTVLNIEYMSNKPININPMTVTIKLDARFDF